MYGLRNTSFKAKKDKSATQGSLEHFMKVGLSMMPFSVANMANPLQSKPTLSIRPPGLLSKLPTKL
jgi:hypothetical protein